MARNIIRDIAFNIPSGVYNYLTSVNKFGRATNVDETKTDIWDRANVSDNQSIWLPPTQARIHDIASSSSTDDLNGTGANTVKVYGLTSWDGDEVSETVELSNIASVPTQNAYVIIYRMKVKTSGNVSINAGTITATAQVDGTVTAQINSTLGQSGMAIYGISSKYTAYISNIYYSVIKGSTSFGTDASFLVNSNPLNQLNNYHIKNTLGMASEGSNYVVHVFEPYYKVTGPAIIKMQSISTANNTIVSSGFDLVLKNN